MQKERFEHFKWVNWSVEYPQGVYSPWKEIFIELNRLPIMVELNSKQGKGILRGIWQYISPLQSEYKVGDLIFDFDSSSDPSIAQVDAARTIEKLCDDYGIDPLAIELFFSGSKGFGARIPHQLFLKNIIPSAQEAYATFVSPYKKKATSIDMALYTRVRLWRLPNSIHPKSSLYRIHLTLDELKTLTLFDIKELAKEKRELYDYSQLYKIDKDLWNGIEKAESKYKEILAYQEQVEEDLPQPKRIDKMFVLPNDPYEILEILRHNPKYVDLIDGVPELYESPKCRGRNGALCKLIGATKKMGCSTSLIEDVALLFNDRCSPPKDKKEIIKVVRFYV